MVATVGSLRINLFADIAEFREGMSRAGKELKRFEKRFDKAGKNIQKAGAALSVGITAPLTLFGREAVKVARDAEELQSAFDFSFGEMSDEVNKFADETGKALGRSKRVIQEQAFTFNQLFKTALNPQQAAELSQEFAVLTNDLASFFNVAEGDALTNLRSGLVGEAEPLRKFGVFLSAAAVETKALELGLVGLNEELTEQDKILARAAIILGQTKDAQGDLIRTSDSFANVQKRFNSELQDLAEIIGKEIIPPLTRLLNFLADASQKFRELDPATRRNVIQMAAWAAALGPALIALGGIVRVLAFATRGLSAFVTVTESAAGGAGRLKLNVAGAATAFLALAPAVFKAGEKLGEFAAEQENFVNGLILLRAIAPKAVGGYGASLDDARAALLKVRQEQSRLAMATNEQAKANDNLRDSSLSSLDDQLKAFKAQQEAQKRLAAQKFQEFLDDNETTLNRIREGIDPIGQGLKVFNEELAIATKAGLDGGKAALFLAKEFIDAAGGIEMVKDRLTELPEVFQQAVNELEAEGAAKQLKEDLEDLQTFADSVNRTFDNTFAFFEEENRLSEAFERGLISVEVYNEAIKELKEDIFGLTAAERQLEDINDIFRSAGRDIAGAVAGFSSFEDVAKRVKAALIDALVIQPFINALSGFLTGAGGGGGIGGLFGRIFGGFRAEGGAVNTRQAFVVGERGPELFVPPSAGRIVPNRDMMSEGGGGFTLNQTIVARDPNAFRASQRQIAREARRNLGIG